MPDWLAILFLAALGACVGSFLNVVIYRLPRGESVIHPGSHCPGCGRAIAGYDNIPVLSYLLLRGRCRACRTPISPRYALVESITAVLFVALYNACYQARMNGWFDRLQYDWPIFAAHLVLLAVLVACSAVDIEYYLIDVRIAYVAMFTGVTAWIFLPALALKQTYMLSGLRLAVYGGVFGAAVGVVVRHLWLTHRAAPAAEEPQEDQTAEPESPPAGWGWPWILGLLVFVAGAVALIVWSAVGGQSREEYQLRAFLYLLWAFLAIIAGAIPRRQADQEIVEIIEQERSFARRTAVRELAELSPVIAGFILGFVLFRYVPIIQQFGQAAYHWPVGPFVPVMGLTRALTGLMVATGFGWLVRIGFTLLFGKEAMGAGDIYILAAVGAVAGPMAAVVGFFVGSVVGVFGVLVLLLWKTSRALSYGPWIAIGTLACLLFYNPIYHYLGPMVMVVRQLCGRH